jgi:hypothetical protein
MKKTLILVGFLLGSFSFAQNTCATAVNVSAGSHVVGTLDGTASTLACDGNVNSQTTPFSEWYSYTPSINYNVTITTDLAINTGKDTNFNVYSGTCGALICQAGDDDSGTIGNGFLSIVTFSAMAGTTYFIAFDNKWSATGFTFELIENTYIPPIPTPVSFTAQAVPTISGTYKNCAVDMNGDYLDDIVTVSSTNVQIHYQQASGSFTNSTITTTAADFLPSWSIAAGDIDKNGFNDLVYGGGSGVTFMKANATGTGFTEISGSQYVFSQRSNMVDINNDGNLDVFVCHDVDPNVYYLNDGNGNLTFYQGGLGDHPEGGYYGSIWVDYDNDGDQDLFIAKCRGGSSTAKINELHQNNGSGVFTNVSVISNMADPIQTWSSAWNDYDNDGDMDALIGASSSTDGTHKLMRNNGNGTFTDITAGSGWDTNTSLNVEHITYDFDNDGFTDVMGGGNKIMRNNGNMTFTPFAIGFTPGPVGDFNNDGFVDVQSASTIFYSNRNANNWIKFNLKGIQSNSNGIGARVEIYGSWGKQIRDIRSGEGFRYMSTLNAHFGIGTATSISQVIIRWPSGVVDTIINPNINQSLLIIEGSSPLGQEEFSTNKIVLYPNPASEQLTISNIDLSTIKNVSIVSMIGKVIKNVKLTNETISIASLSEGIYILAIETIDGKKYTERFVKKN